LRLSAFFFGTFMQSRASRLVGTYVELVEGDALDRMRRVKAGVPAQQLTELSVAMGIPFKKLCGKAATWQAHHQAGMAERSAQVP
jgi:hypothetical protein